MNCFNQGETLGISKSYTLCFSEWSFRTDARFQSAMVEIWHRTTSGVRGRAAACTINSIVQVEVRGGACAQFQRVLYLRSNVFQSGELMTAAVW